MTRENMLELSNAGFAVDESLNRFEYILSNMSYTDKNVPANDEIFFHMRHMEDACNAKTTKVFEPFWVIVIDESTQEWINKFTCPAWMCVVRNPHPFGD